MNQNIQFNLKDRLSSAAIDESEGLLFDQETFASYGLNETGLWLIHQAEAANGVLAPDSLAAKMANHFKISHDQALEDILVFCRALAEIGLAKEVVTRQPL